MVSLKGFKLKKFLFTASLGGRMRIAWPAALQVNTDFAPAGPGPPAIVSWISGNKVTQTLFIGEFLSRDHYHA
jgi:hypothetical protein